MFNNHTILVHMKRAKKTKTSLTTWDRSRTANLFLATQTAVTPEDLLLSGASGFWLSLSLGIM